MKDKFTIIGLIFFALFLFAVFKNTADRDYPNFSRAYLGGQEIKLEIAETDSARKKGLSERSSLPKNHGLLFLFPREDKYGIWMKDMNFPIDIIWADEDLKIVGLKKNARPESYPKVFYPQAPSSYILEINSGIIQKQGIKIGEKLEIF